MIEKREGYNVIFRYTKISGCEGAMTWTGYLSKQSFEGRRAELLSGGWQTIEAEGVSRDEAVRICRGASLSSGLHAAKQEGVDPATSLVYGGSHTVGFEKMLALVPI